MDKRTPLPFSETLPILLLRARRAVTDRFRPGMSAFGVTEHQWRVLRVLGEGGEFGVTALAAATFIGGPSLSRMLKDMLARGLIHRRTDQSDQRFGRVSITKTGLRLLDEMAPGAYATMDEINRSYGPIRMGQIRTLLLELEMVLADAEAEVCSPPADLSDLEAS